MMTIMMAKSVEVSSQLAGVDHDMAAQIFRNSRLEPTGDMTKKDPDNFTQCFVRFWNVTVIFQTF